MALFDLSSAAEALEDLLDRERALIKAGRIDQIVRLGAEKERLIGRLARQGASAPGLERLRAKAASDCARGSGEFGASRPEARRPAQISVGASTVTRMRLSASTTRPSNWLPT